VNKNIERYNLIGTKVNLNLNLLINIDFATIKVEIHLSFTRLVVLKKGYINIFTEAYLLKYV
jgi:hypothetical protein